MSGIKINCARRAVLSSGRISASLDTGSHKLQSGYGNGDCLLLDFHSQFFAMSDSTDRWPDASRNILLRLTENLSGRALPQSADEWLYLVNGLYATQQYLYRATFSGVALQDTPTGKNAVIIQGGDSIVIIVDPAAGIIKFQTASDMNFVGRAKCIPEALSIPLDCKNDMIIIGSDGIADIARLSGLTLEEMCIAAVSRYSVDEVTHQISHLLERMKENIQHDDIGIIAIDPGRIEPVAGTVVLMGGTMPGDEKRYSQKRLAGAIPDEWRDISEIDGKDESLADAGIMILSK